MVVAVQLCLKADQHSLNRHQSSCPVCRGNVSYVFFGEQEENGPVRKMNRGGKPAGRSIRRRRGNRRQRFDCCFDERELKRYYVTTWSRQRRYPPGVTWHAVRRR